MKVKLSWSNLQLSLLVLEVSVLCLAVATLAEDSAEGEVGSGKEKPVLEKVKKEKGSPPVTKFYENTKDPVIGLEGFELCEIHDCNQVCGTRDPKQSFCDAKNNKLCMCTVDNFMTTNVEGLIVPVNRDDPNERNCSLACNTRNSYARIWRRNDNSSSCACLMNQITKTGVTLCDEFAVRDLCKDFCKSETAACVFSGVCLCKEGWADVFHLNLTDTRLEVETDSKDCSRRCKDYHTEYVGRIYDTKMKDSSDKKYDFREKYCFCGEELEAEDPAVMNALHEQGFQECTGLKCKARCGMNMEAMCEPKLRRACLCPRNTIFIGKFLWARLPTRKETLCVETCVKAGLAPRVIEWNPFFEPSLDRTSGVYRKSKFQYLYDGKFCHCISLKNEPDINQFRPCSNELCQWICGHNGATCDMKTRRFCICNTHQMAGGLGRRPDPGETNCNIMCRRNLNDARVLDVIWDIPPPHWSVPKPKFCGCIRPVTPAGLSHCDGMEGRDICPTACKRKDAYCTQDKVCECFVQPNITAENALVRLPNGKEYEECGEVCRSWIWPLVEDIDHMPLIYDEGRQECFTNNSCPEVDTTPWTPDQPGALRVQIDALEQNTQSPKKYCLCSKTDSIFNKPGIRMPFNLEPPRLPKQLHCISNYTCIPVGNSMHIVG